MVDAMKPAIKAEMKPHAPKDFRPEKTAKKPFEKPYKTLGTPRNS